MNKTYSKPELYVDTFMPDTMIASSGANPKNGNADNNQNCWGCNQIAGQVIEENVCIIIEGTPAYEAFC